MNQLRSKHPLTTNRAADINANIGLPPATVLAAPPAANINYVLRRYGGLNVFVPRFSIATFLEGLDVRTPTTPTPTPQGLHQHPQTPVRQLDPAEQLSSSSESSEYLRIPDNLERASQIRDPFGKFTPLFGGRIVLGNGKWLFLVTIILFAIYIANTALMKGPLEKFCGGLPVYVAGIVLGGLMLCTFVILGITDPGVVPKNYSLTELLAETEDYRGRYPDERYFRYCSKCRICRPPRTFHCSKCEICIRQQDTHLWAAGLCIGERNRRSYFFHVMFQTFYGAYLLATSLIIAPHIIKGSKGYTKELIQLVASAVTGVGLLFVPQSGIFMLIYKMYLIGVGRTAREEYRKYHCYDTEDCVVDRLPVCVNIGNFFCQKSMPSAFRRRLNRIDPEGIQVAMPDAWILEQTLPRRRQRIQLQDSRDLIQVSRIDCMTSIESFIEPEVDEEDIAAVNAARILNENYEATRLREVANCARGKSTASVPIFDHNLNPIMTRIKMPRKSKPYSILQQQINAFHRAAQLPKATVSNHKRQKLPVSLSDGCIPRTKDGLQEMIQLSRATQLRRIIQMILLRDRNGLIEMSNRVNIAALVGMNQFDPDNLQLLELNNGLPMIAPRRRDPEAGNHRLGAGVLGIPQMVAAGLLPTARDLANSVETMMVGRGRVRRLPPVGRQRYTPITITGNHQAATAAPRRVLSLNVDPLVAPLVVQAQNNLPNPHPQPTPPPTSTASQQHNSLDPRLLFPSPTMSNTNLRTLSSPSNRRSTNPVTINPLNDNIENDRLNISNGNE